MTSAGRKEQRLGDVPAAIYVMTQDDIRRSGMTTLPELLRLVPGVQVAQINSNTRAGVTRHLDLSVVGQNLLEPSHAEYAGREAIVTPTLVPRSVRIELRWRP